MYSYTAVVYKCRTSNQYSTSTVYQVSYEYFNIVLVPYLPARVLGSYVSAEQSDRKIAHVLGDGRCHNCSTLCRKRVRLVEQGCTNVGKNSECNHF